MSRLFTGFALVVMLTALMSGYAWAEITWGLQGGFSAKDVDDEDFQQYLLSATYSPGWIWEIAPGWSMETEINASAGALSGGGKTGFIGTLGPRLRFGRESIPVQLDFGLSPTVLSKRKFDDANFGSYLQFTSHIGVLFLFGENWSAGYRFQHMSNASISDNNPGLNTHLFQVNHRF